MGWIAFIKALLAAVNAVASIIHDKQLMAAGEAKTVAREMAVIAARLQIGAEIVRQVEAMSDDDLDAELRGDR